MFVEILVIIAVPMISLTGFLLASSFVKFHIASKKQAISNRNSFVICYDVRHNKGMKRRANSSILFCNLLIPFRSSFR